MAEITFSQKNPAYPLMCASFRAMHTKVELLAVGVDDEKGRDLMQRAEAEVRRLERLLSCHDDASPLSALNSLAWEQSVEAEDELYMVLELCETFRRATYGYFDVTAMCSETDGVMSLAGGYSLDAKHHSVRFCRKGVKIDLGGFAKGYALDCIKRMSQQEGITQGVINFGNSSIAALGHHPYGEWWPIGIEHRMVKSALAQEVRLADSAMSISGRSEAGEYHIIDPHTGSRVAGEELILIEGRSALVCEVLSTALYAAPRAKRADIMSQYDGYRASEIVCRRDGTTECRVVGATVVEK